MPATGGHGALWAMELDPTGAPGSFTTIAQQTGSAAPPGMSRAETEVTAHNDGIDTWIVSQVIRREQITLTLNHLFDDQTHDSVDGVYAALMANETRGFRWRGPTGAANDDEVIASGRVTNIQQELPAREGARTSTVTIRLSGAMKLDGTTIS